MAPGLSLERPWSTVVTLGLSVAGGCPRKGTVSLRGLCPELVAVDFTGLCAGLPLGPAGMGVAFKLKRFSGDLGGGGREGRNLLSS